MKENIYEIPKVHPFIKTLEKVKELRDNLDEHIEITSQLWEDGKASDAYYYSAEIYHECQKILVNAASLMSCTWQQKCRKRYPKASYSPARDE